MLAPGLWAVHAVCCITLGALCGCRSTSQSVGASGALRFTEQEIRSKTWADAQGQVIRLLDWTATCFHGEELVIAKYGAASPPCVTCLEFYRIHRRPPGPALKAPDLSRNHMLPITPAYTNIPEGLSFELLLHDYVPEMVTSLSTEERGDTYLITVLRETVPAGTTPRQALRYILTYKRSQGLQWNPNLEQWALPDSKP